MVVEIRSGGKARNKTLSVSKPGVYHEHDALHTHDDDVGEAQQEDGHKD